MRSIQIKKYLLLLGICCALHLGAQVPEGIPTRGLQAFWPFSGNTDDVSGRKRDGRSYGTKLVKDRFGNDNSACYFNGTSDYITTSYEGVLGTHPRAVSFWAITYHNTQKGMPCILWGDHRQFPNNGGRFNCCFGSCYTCPEKGEFMGATIDVADAGVTFEGQEPVTDGKWHHYVFQFDKKYLRDVEVYQDGLLLTHELYRFYKNCPLNTGRGSNVTFGVLFAPTDTCFFKGLMDDIAIYDRALSPGEIEALYTIPDPNKKANLFKWIPVFFAAIGFIMLLVWFIRLRVKKLVAKEKEKMQVEKKWYEQENRVLKAQMDPHFIFNSLNSIQKFIIVNDNEKAQLYLSTFAQLIRMQLESNTNENIPLKQEIEILEKYLEIESLRFNNAFDYEIIVSDLDVGSIYIPYFLIQPFVENAIHHGLLPKIGYKELTIIIELQDEKTLKCIVEDNGIGRKNSGSKETPFKTKSLGVNFVQQRLLIMSKIENRHYGVEITDKTNHDGTSSGTRAVITLPIQTKP